MNNDMDEITSLQFNNLEDNLQLMIEPLKNDQEFLRYILNLNDYPLDQDYIDDNGNIVQQPDILTPYDLIKSQMITLTLFNPNILKETKVQIFFSPLQGTSSEGDPIFHNIYIVDIIVPYNFMIINSTGKLRLFRIANRISKLWNNQYLAGIGRTIMYNWKTYVVNSNYQGMTMMFKVDDSAFTDDSIE